MCFECDHQGLYLVVHEQISDYNFSENTLFLCNLDYFLFNRKHVYIYIQGAFSERGIISLGGSQCWVHVTCKSIFYNHQRCVYIFDCPAGALKLMYLLSSAQQGSDPVFTFTTLLGTKPMTYDKFTKCLKQLLNSQA